jgi:sec-independent protein translocase protein TatC
MTQNRFLTTVIDGRNEQSAQPLIAHLVELKRRVIWSLVVFFIAAAVCYGFSTQIYAFLTHPLEQGPNATTHRLIYTGLTEAFTTYIKVSMFGGIFLTVPFIMVQIWLFMSPGLYSNERRAILPFFIFAPFLFVAGACFSFFVFIPLAWKFFLSFESPATAGGLPIILEARVAEYLSLTTTFILSFGLAFQLPIVLGLMGKLNLIQAKALARFRKWALVLILCVAALLAPPDVLSQVALAIPLYCLYEISVWLVTWMQRGKTTPEDAENV